MLSPGRNRWKEWASYMLLATAVCGPLAACRNSVSTQRAKGPKSSSSSVASVDDSASPSQPEAGRDFQGNAARKGGTLTNGKTYCEFTWEEKPGYADYTTVDQYELSNGIKKRKSLDRTQTETLQGSNKLKGDLCANAHVLKPCYVQSVERDQAGNAIELVRWAEAKRLDLMLVKMAFAYQETKLGALSDSCASGSCNGVGIAQIITAIAPDRTTLSTSDPRWAGITFNVLTNLSYSSRVLQAKIKETGPSVDLVELARAYNGNPNSGIRIPYGTKVDSHYQKLKSCGF